MNNIVLDPSYLAYRFDFNSESIEFLPIQTSELRRLSFLRADAISSDRAHQAVSVPLNEIVELLNDSKSFPTKKRPRFIFHTAYCASTFVSRALDCDGSSLSLREPQLLLDAANAKRLNWKSSTCGIGFKELTKLALLLLQKHCSDDECLIIKPINSVNNLIPEILAAAEPTRSLILYSDVKRFVLSTFKKGEQARQTTRAMFDLLRCDFPHLSQLSLSNALHMSDLKLTLTLWRLQIEQIRTVIDSLGESQKVRTLDVAELDRNPSEQLVEVNRFLETAISDEKLVHSLQSGLLARDAKSPAASYDRDQRDASYQRVYEFFKEDIENGFRWMVNNNPKLELKPTLPLSLTR